MTAQGDTKVEALQNLCKIAYELLYSMDMLNRKETESYASKQKRHLIENDYYDSDDDTFYDRTGSIEQKRQRRIKDANKIAQNEFIVSEFDNYKSYFDSKKVEFEYIPTKKIVQFY